MNDSMGLQEQAIEAARSGWIEDLVESRNQSLAGFAPIRVQDDAIIKRLQNAASQPSEELLRQQGQQPVVEGTALDLASLAPKLVAIDERTGDPMQRPLKEQRGLQKGDKQWLPGKLAGLEPGSLLLFDRGYFAFRWFDDLSQRGYRWVSRLREKRSYELVPVLWRFEGNLDALIWLGAHRAGKLARLLRFWDGEQLHTSISTGLDRRVLSIKEIAQLYGRRWDLE
jgi:Transposase DDE domain